MRARRLAVAGTALLAPALLVGCGGGDDDAGGGTVDDLPGRLRAVLEADGGAVEGDVASAEVVCPVVREVAAGDLATCVLTFDDGREVEVDVEFDADGAFAVVAVQER